MKTRVGGIESSHTTELDALANAGKATGAAVDNRLSGARVADLELYVAGFGGVPAAGATVDVYVLPAVDGANYADGAGAGVAPAATLLVGQFPVRAANAAQRLALTDVAVPVAVFKFLLVNSTGQALAAGGHTLKYQFRT